MEKITKTAYAFMRNEFGKQTTVKFICQAPVMSLYFNNVKERKHRTPTTTR